MSSSRVYDSDVHVCAAGHLYKLRDPTASLLRCQSCCITYYCSKECQTNMWYKGHRERCTQVAAARVGDWVERDYDDIPGHCLSSSRVIPVRANTCLAHPYDPARPIWEQILLYGNELRVVVKAKAYFIIEFALRGQGTPSHNPARPDYSQCKIRLFGHRPSPERPAAFIRAFVQLVEVQCYPDQDPLRYGIVYLATEKALWALRMVHSEWDSKWANLLTLEQPSDAPIVPEQQPEEDPFMNALRSIATVQTFSSFLREDLVLQRLRRDLVLFANTSRSDTKCTQPISGHALPSMPIEKKLPACGNSADSNADDGSSCIICTDATACVRIEPCLHMIMCEKCTNTLYEKTKCTEPVICPICRCEIAKVISLKE